MRSISRNGITGTLRRWVAGCGTVRRIALCCLIPVFPWRSAAGGEYPIRITLEDAVELALEKNQEIRIARHEIEKSRSGVTVARSTLWPRLEANGQYLRNIDKPVMFIPPGSPFAGAGEASAFEIGFDNSYTAGLGLSMPVFSTGVYSSIRLARRATDLAEETYRGTRIIIIANVKKAFYRVLLARDVRDVTLMSFENARENLENVRELQEQGLVAEYDLIRAEVRYENVRPQALQAENAYELAKDALKIAIGLDAALDMEIDGQLAYDGPVEIPAPKEAQEELLAENSLLRQLHCRVRLTDEKVTLERTAYWPSLAAFGSYQYQTQANDYDFSDYDWRKSSSVGLSLQIPLFEGFARRARVSRARLEQMQAVERRDAVTEAAKTQLQSVLYSIEQAKKRIEVQVKAVAQAERGYDIARTRYSSGVGTHLEANDADLALTVARVNHIQAVYDYKVALAELELLTGRVIDSY